MAEKQAHSTETDKPALAQAGFLIKYNKLIIYISTALIVAAGAFFAYKKCLHFYVIRILKKISFIFHKFEKIANKIIL